MSNNQIIQTLQREGYSTSNIFSAMSQANMKAEVDMGSSAPQEETQAPMGFGAPEPVAAPAAEAPPAMPPTAASGPAPEPVPAAAPAPEETPFYMQEQGAPGAAPDLPAGPMPEPAAQEAYPQEAPMEAPFAQQQMGPPGLPTGAPAFGPAPETQRIEELAEAIIDEKWNEIVRSINKIIDWKERIESRVTKIEQSLQDMGKEFDSLHRGVLGKISEYDKSLVNVGTEIKAMEKVFQKVLPTLTENVNELSRLKDNLKK